MRKVKRIKKTKKTKPYIIGIAGGTGSGKSLLASKLADVDLKRVSVLELDAYYKSIKRGKETNANFDKPDSLDNDLIIGHLEMLKKGRSTRVPIYNFKTHRRSKKTKKLSAAPIIIVNGIFVLSSPMIRKYLDLKIYVDVDDDIRFGYRLIRDIEERGYTPRTSFEYYKRIVRPMHEKWVEPTKKYADLIVTNNETDFIVAADVLRPKIREELAKRI